MSYRAARLHRLAELIPWNQFLGSLKVLKYRLSEGEDVLRVIRPVQNSICMGQERGSGTGNNRRGEARLENVQLNLWFAWVWLRNEGVLIAVKQSKRKQIEN